MIAKPRVHDAGENDDAMILRVKENSVQLVRKQTVLTFDESQSYRTYTMNPTTSAHIDPSTLQTFPSGPESIPALSVRPNPSAQTQTTSSTSTSTSSSIPTATGLRQRFNKIGNDLDAATDHPAVQNAKGAAAKQIDQLRQALGRVGFVRDLEARTGVDRVVLVLGGAFA